MKIGHLKNHNGTTYHFDTDHPFDQSYHTRVFLHAGNGEPEAGINPSVNVVLSPDQELKLSGLLVPPAMRKQGWAEILMEIAFRIGEAMETPIQKTVSIRKPLIALLLTKYGFQPENRQILAEILPRTNPHDPTPSVRIGNSIKNFSLQAKRSEWFRTVEGVLDPNSGNPIVAIQTPYLLTDPGLATKMRNQTREKINSRLRIFPNQLRKALLS